MKGFRIYPRIFWILLLIAVVTGWIFPAPFVIWIISISAVLAPWLRHLFLNPMTGADQPYYQWLKTVPYSPGKPLPNGNLVPGLQDAIVVAMLCSVIVRLDTMLSLRIFLATSCLALMLIVFTIIAARDFLNVGPRRIGYFCLCVLILWSSSPCFSFYEEVAYAQICGIAVWLCPVLIALTGTLVGLKIMMYRYPWGGSGLRHGAILDNRSFTELTYGHSQLQDLGEPFTSINPRATWPRLDSVHVYGLSALAGSVSFSILSYAPHFDAGVFAFVGLGVTWSRMMTYYRNLIPTVPRIPRAELFTNGNWRRNFAFSLFLLLIFTATGYSILRVTSGHFGVALSSVGAFLITVAAFRLPPSRKTWETVGFRQIDLLPTVADPSLPSDKRKSFKLSRL